MGLRWMEAMLPLGIIAGMLCLMGNIQYQIHKTAHGRPKHIGSDMWDVAMERRDQKLLDEDLGLIAGVIQLLVLAGAVESGLE